jgi:hypothetical protein
MKFEFGDLYKFFVSLGVVLVTLAVITPWLFLKEPFDLFKTQNEISTLTSVAKETVGKRQELALSIINFLPAFSITGISLGFLMGGFGLNRWHKNQQIIDEQTRIELELSKQSLRDATLDEVDAKREQELDETLQQASSEGDDISRFSRSEIASDAFNVERSLVTKLKNIYGNKYEILTEKIVNGAYIDITLRGRGSFTKDFLIELKYIRKGFNYGWLKEVALKLRQISILYAQAENRIPNTILIIVSKPDVWNNPKYLSFLRKLGEDMSHRAAKHRVIYLTNEEIENLSSEKFQEKVGINA